MNDKSHVGMTNCFFCGEGAEILLDRRLQDTLPRECGVVSMRPCPKCEELMKQGVILLGYDEDKSDMELTAKEHESWREAHNAAQGYASGSRAYEREMREAGLTPYNFIPAEHVYRSGHFLVVRDEFIKRNFPESLIDSVIKSRWVFYPGTLCAELNAQHEKQHA